MLVTAKSSIFYDIRKQSPDNLVLKLGLVALAVLALAAVACNGDGSPSADGSPGATLVTDIDQVRG